MRFLNPDVFQKVKILQGDYSPEPFECEFCIKNIMHTGITS